ncbi:MAG TPA: hypothetical protein VF796_21715 [Humisphaera sp.]
MSPAEQLAAMAGGDATVADATGLGAAVEAAAGEPLAASPAPRPLPVRRFDDGRTDVGWYIGGALLALGGLIVGIGFLAGGPPARQAFSEGASVAFGVGALLIAGAVSVGLFVRSPTAKWACVLLACVAACGYVVPFYLGSRGSYAAIAPAVLVALVPPVGWLLLLDRASAVRVFGACVLVVGGELLKLAVRSLLTGGR